MERAHVGAFGVFDLLTTYEDTWIAAQSASKDRPLDFTDLAFA
jgi:hypothetical protein